ncbi:hypothetical protein MASR2M39_00430 [Ignavibacteriales bacterium]
MTGSNCVKTLLILLLLPGFLVAQVKKENSTLPPDSVKVQPRDSIIRIDTIVRIDSVFIFDTIRPTQDTIQKVTGNTEPIIIFADSTSNHIPTFDEMLDSVNIVQKIGIFKLILIFFILAVASALSYAISLLKRNNLIKNKLLLGTIKSVPVIRSILWLITLWLILKLLFVQTQLMMLFFVILLAVLTGIALLPLLRNIVGRLSILSGNMFGKNDYIRCGSLKGFVQEIGWREVTLLSDEGSAIFIPNSKFLDTPFENVSLGKKEELLSLDFQFPSSFDPERTMEILKEAAISNPFLYIDKQPEVFMKSVDFINNRFTIKVNLYLYDSGFIDELYDAINKAVLIKLRQSDPGSEANGF